MTTHRISLRYACMIAASGALLIACGNAPDVTPTRVPLPAAAYVSAVWGAADDDVWVVGTRTGPGARTLDDEGVLVHWDGRVATSVAHPALILPSALGGTNGADVWLAATDSRTRSAQLLRWNGTAWAVAWSRPTPTIAIGSVAAVANNDVWFGARNVSPERDPLRPPAGPPVLLHWNGSDIEVHNLALPASDRACTGLRALVARARGELWLTCWGTHAIYYHAPESPLDSWTAFPAPLNTVASALIDASDGSVLRVQRVLSAWDPVARTFGGAIGGEPLPFSDTVATAATATSLWAIGHEAVGPTTCSTGGSFYSGIRTDCRQGVWLPAILRWNGSAWSSTSMPDTFGRISALWRAPQSGDLWIGGESGIVRVRAADIR